MNRILSVIMAACLFVGCSITPSQVQLGTSVGVANYLALTKEPQKSEMASLFGMVAALPIDHVMTPAEFQALLNQRLPNNSAKALTVVDATLIYSMWYPTLEKKTPTQVTPYITAILQGIAQGVGTVVPVDVPLTQSLNQP